MSCWVERYVARQRSAKAHLEGCGFHVQRQGGDAIAAWHVSSFAGALTTEQMIVIANRYGFEKEQAA